MKDFFERQDDARWKSALILPLLVLAVAFLVFGIYCIYLTGRYMALSIPRGTTFFVFEPKPFLYIASGTMVLVLAGTLYKIRALSDGGRAVARILGGTPVDPDTKDINLRRLRNVVEEMAIASGTPVPEVYVLEREGGINAFAAGYGVDDTVICVTRGAVELLTRDEIQGVIAHEFSHILNSDTLLNIRLMGVLHGILMVTLIGKAMLRGSGRSSRREGSGLALLGLAMIAVGYTGWFMGNLIKSAVSRQREYLADASAVQFTRNPMGLAGALKKIGGLPMGSRLVHQRADELSHMYFCEGIGDRFMAFLDTHPPLPDRIIALDPGFDGVYPELAPIEIAPLAVEEAPVARRVVPKPPAPAMPQMLTPLAVAALLEATSNPVKEHLDSARSMVAAIPGALLDAARDTARARTLIYAMLIAESEPEDAAQLADVARLESSGAAEDARALVGQIRALHKGALVPLADIAIPALRRMEPDALTLMSHVMRRLIAADGKVSLFEYSLTKLVLRRLEAHFMGPARNVVQIYSVRGVERECSLVLTVVTRLGHKDAEQAAEAFLAGARVLYRPRARFSMVPPGECTFAALDRALARLNTASPSVKRALLAACLTCIELDGVISVREAEIFRALAEALGCPLPAWTPGNEEAA